VAPLPSRGVDIAFIRKVRRPNGVGVWPAYVVDVDEFGTWLFSPKGSLYRGEKNNTVIGVVEVGQGDRDAGIDVLHLTPHRGWWFAAWWDLDDVRHLTVDISLPPVLADGLCTYVDLEIDLYKTNTGQIGVVDVDEFDDACAVGQISDDEQREALAATELVEALLRGDSPPMDHSGWRRLDQLRSRELRPLIDLPPPTDVATLEGLKPTGG
jgi:hypothetical protein